MAISNNGSIGALFSVLPKENKMKNKPYDYHVNRSQGETYNQAGMFAVYAWEDLPSHTCSPENPIRVRIAGPYDSIEAAVTAYPGANVPEWLREEEK